MHALLYVKHKNYRTNKIGKNVRMQERRYYEGRSYDRNVMYLNVVYLWQ